jgi:hypothetical protein
MDVPPGRSLTPNSSHVSELVPVNGGTLVTAGWSAVEAIRATVKPLFSRSCGGVFAIARAVSANNRQKVAARKHAMKRFRFLPS